MNKIFKPHRGKASIMSNQKKNVVLEAGELFIELPDDNSSDRHCKMKIGDGNTAYENLPYAINDHNYDIEMSTNLDEITLKEDNVQKNTLPLVTTFIGTQAEWNTLSSNEKSKYRILHITDDSGDTTTTNTEVDFLSNDTTDANADSWTSVTQLESGLSLSTLFTRVSQMFKNVRFLYNGFNDFKDLELCHSLTTTYNAPDPGNAVCDQAFTIPTTKYNKFNLFFITVACFNNEIEEPVGFAWKNKTIYQRFNEFYVNAPTNYYTQINIKCPANSPNWLYTRVHKSRTNTVIRVYGIF